MRVGRGLGCLTGCLTRLALGLVVGTMLVAAIAAVFAPWSFFLGGRSHPLPLWQGIGTMHAKSGDYVLYVWMAPAPGGRTFNFPYFRGWGYLCTPRGERFALRLSAFMNEHPGIDTNGKEFQISIDDGGSISRAFLPDGTLYTGTARNQSATTERLSIVLHEAAWSGWFSDCRAALR